MDSTRFFRRFAFQVNIGQVVFSKGAHHATTTQTHPLVSQHPLCRQSALDGAGLPDVEMLMLIC